MPILNIKDPEVHALASELAHRTGKTRTQVVKDASRDELTREGDQHDGRRRLVGRVLELAKRAPSRPVLGSRSPDEIMGYDELGIPR